MISEQNVSSVQKDMFWLERNHHKHLILMELDEEPYKRVEQVKKIDKMMMEPVSIFLFM